MRRKLQEEIERFKEAASESEQSGMSQSLGDLSSLLLSTYHIWSISSAFGGFIDHLVF